MPPKLIPLVAALLISGGAMAQDTTAPASDTDAEEQPKGPDFNGRLTGTFSNRNIDIPVVCSGFGGGGRVAVQSDPGDDPTQDTTGDGVVADIEAFPSGDINLNLMAANARSKISDSSATVERRRLTFALTMTFVGGGEERVEIDVDCRNR